MDDSTPRKQKDGDRYFIDNVFLRGGWGAALGPYSIAIYNAIAMHANSEQKAWPSHSTLANLTGMSTRQVIREIEKLAEYNIVKIESRQEERKPGVITLLDKNEWIPVESATNELTDNNQKRQHMTVSHMTDNHMTHSHMQNGSTYDTQSYEHMTGSHTNKTHITNIPKGGGRKLPPSNGLGAKPEKTTPKWQLMNEFIAITQIPIPNQKSDERYFWTKIGAIYDVVNRDVELGKKLMKQAYDKLIEDELTVSDPGSLLKTVRAIMAKGNVKVVLK